MLRFSECTQAKFLTACWGDASISTTLSEQPLFFSASPSYSSYSEYSERSQSHWGKPLGHASGKTRGHNYLRSSGGSKGVAGYIRHLLHCAVPSLHICLHMYMCMSPATLYHNLILVWSQFVILAIRILRTHLIRSGNGGAIQERVLCKCLQLFLHISQYAVHFLHSLGLFICQTGQSV